MERFDNIFDRNGKNDLHWSCVIHNKGKFYMYYNFGMTSSGPTPYMTGLAISDDGINFRIEKDIIFGPETNSWDCNMLEVHSIVRENGLWRMYYCGMDKNWSIGYAESDDLIEWKKYKLPIIQSGMKLWENIHVADPYVIFFKGKYLMYYMGKGEVWQVGLAISYDGKEFYKYTENPIITNNEKWCDGCVCISGVIVHDKKLIAAVHGYNTTTHKFISKLIESDDGIKWRKYIRNGEEVIIEPGEWSDRGIVHPEIIKNNDKMYIYYTGIRKGVQNQHRIGLVII